MPYVSPKQVVLAREMDLLTYLQNYEPNELVQFSGSTYTTRTHDSLKISNGKWFWWSRGIGGRTALDYLIQVRELSLPEAVTALVGISAISNVPRSAPHTPVPDLEEQKKDFALPPKHADNRRVFSYLKSRGIDPEIINHCIRQELLYEEAEHHNCVFVGYEKDTPRYGALRSTLSSSTYAGEVPGSDKRFSFAVSVKHDQNVPLCVFESAIDALSFLTLMKKAARDWKGIPCLSLGGIYPQKKQSGKLPLALAHYLKCNVRVPAVVLCLDNDKVGREAARDILQSLTLSGYAVRDNPPTIGKDYNEKLQIKCNLKTQVAIRGKELSL